MYKRQGVGIEIASAEEVANATVESTSLQETILGFVPTNIIGSMADSAMVPCIVFALFFGIAMGAYTRQSGNLSLIHILLFLRDRAGIRTEPGIYHDSEYICPDDRRTVMELSLIHISTLFAAMAVAFICPRITVCNAVLTPQSPWTNSIGARCV